MPGTADGRMEEPVLILVIEQDKSLICDADIKEV
jgi:hypothetical protein